MDYHMETGKTVLIRSLIWRGTGLTLQSPGEHQVILPAGVFLFTDAFLSFESFPSFHTIRLSDNKL